MHKILLILLLALCLTPLSHSNASEKNQPLMVGDLLYVPVLYDGRIMPLDSFAEITFEKIAGKKLKNSAKYLTQTIFNPEVAIHAKIFTIPNAENFNLTPKERYDFTIVSKIISDNQKTLDKLIMLPEKDLSIEQKDFLILYDNYIIYNQLLRSMTAIIPLKISGKDTPTSYLDLLLQDPAAVQKHPETKIMAAAAKNNILFKLIPTNQEKTNFISPWAAITNDTPKPAHLATLKQWQDLALAYRAHDKTTWEQAISNLVLISQTPITTLEKTYNDLSLVTVSLVLFILAFLFFTTQEFFKFSKGNFIARILLGIASLTITTDIIMRVIITHRPPVGTLYESILFVCATIALGCSIYILKKLNSTAIFIAAISGIILLLTAKSFVGVDSFSPLVAVLNTDFWLATHVIIITAGYGFCLITSLYAHIIMFFQNYNKKAAPYKNLNVLTILSLLFVTVGTILGGLWADQSWGRFWGWDPKENGAMLIALWIIWLLHGKITHDLPIKYYMAGIAFLSVIVALAWFGVNLLSVGLHSYGFISGIAFGLGSFIALEIVIISYLLFFHKRQVT